MARLTKSTDSVFLNGLIRNGEQDDPACDMTIVFVDIVSYSRRSTRIQKRVIDAFARCLLEAFDETARVHLGYLRQWNLYLPRDLVVVPAGDGAAVGFPFQGEDTMPLTFVKSLYGAVDRHNHEEPCSSFEEHHWCKEHSHFALRTGISEGKVILFKDVNGGYNVAGTPVNMASRVMNIAGARQVFLAENYAGELSEILDHFDHQIRRYDGITIKHDLVIAPYQYIADSPGIDASPRSDLTLWTSPDERKPATARIRTNALLHTPAAKRASRRPASEAEAKGNSVVKAVEDDLVLVPCNGEASADPLHPGAAIPIASPFLMGKHAMTQAIYREVMGVNPSHFQGDRHPVELVTWSDAVSFCNKLSELSGLEPVYQLTGQVWTAAFDRSGYRLPTEAEWEYACTECRKTSSFSPLDHYAWYSANSSQTTHDVGELAPNALGIYDMLGNVLEWCQDWYGAQFPSPEGAGGPATGYERVLRGGSWIDLASATTPFFRHRRSALVKEKTIGFRIVRQAHPNTVRHNLEENQNGK